MGDMSRYRYTLLQLLLGLAAAVLAGFLLQGFWQLFGLPDRPGPGFWQDMVRPYGLGRFVTLALPAAAFLPTLALSIMTLLLPAESGPELQEHCRQAQRYDAYTYLLLVTAVVLVLIWNVLGNGFLAMGLCFLGLVTVKTFILLRLLWLAFLCPAAQSASWHPRRKLVAAFLVALIIFGLPAAWLNQSLSASRSEAIYLLKTHALVGGHTTTPAAPDKEHQGFYWRSNQDQSFRAPAGDIVEVFALGITPAYAAAGRLGVLVLLAVLMALLASQLLAWLEGLGVAPGAAASATGLALTAAPVYFAAGQILPEAAGMLLLVCGLRLLEGIRQRAWLALGVLVPLCALLILLELRLAPLALGLLAVGLFEALRLRAGRLAAGITLLAVAAAVAILCWQAPPTGWPLGLGRRLSADLSLWQQAPHWWSPIAAYVSGLLLDQNYGLLFTAPLFLLALGGLVVSLWRRTRPSLYLLLPGLIYLAAACLGSWHRLPGELSPPGLLLAVLLPATALYLAPVLASLSRPWWRLAIWIPAGYGLAYTWFLTLLPWLRLGHTGAPNPLAQAAAKSLGQPVVGRVPLLVASQPALLISLAVATALVVFYLLMGLRPAPAASSRWRANEALALALALGLLGWGFLVALSPGAA